MNKCHQFREKLYLYHYGELPDAEMRVIREHCQECGDCAGELRHIKEVLALINTKAVPEQSAQFWADYDLTLRRRLKKRFPMPSFSFGLAPRLAVGAIVLVVGLLIVMRTHVSKERRIASLPARVVETAAPEAIEPSQELEDALLLQELALLSELGEEIDLPSNDEDLIEDFEMLESVSIT